MSRTRVFARLGITAGAVFATLWIASPAFAADAVQTDISGLASTFTAGARGDTFRATMKNTTDAEIQPIRRTVVVRLAGMTSSNVRIFAGFLPLPAQSAGQDEVRFAETLQVRLGPKNKNGDELRQEYSIQFTADAPNGKGEVIFQAYQGSVLLGSTAQSITIKNGVVLPSTSTSTTPRATSSTQGGVTPGSGSTAGVPVPVSPLAPNNTTSSTAAGSSIPTIFYVLGAILVTSGAAILWLLFRPRPALVTDHPGGDYQPGGGYQPAGQNQPAGRNRPMYQPPPSHPDPAPTLGYPKVAPAPPTPRSANAPHIQSTQVMPTVPGPASPPPAVDPWATRDDTPRDDIPRDDIPRGFGPRSD